MKGGEKMLEMIKKNLIETLKQDLDIPIFAENLHENIKESSLFVEMLAVEQKRLLNKKRERTFTFLLTYIPKKDELRYEECMDMAEKLYEILDMIGSEEKFLACQMAHKMENGKLLFSVGYKCILMLQEEVALMHNLEVNERRIS